NNLVAAEQAFTEGLRLGGESFVYHIFQDDVNRWIAMRREIYPLIDQLVPTELSDPFVRFDADRIAVAGRVSTPAGRVVLSIDVAPVFEDRAIVLRATAVRCGSVSMPMDFGGLDLARSIEREPEKVWPGSPRIWGDLAAGLHLDARAWWKNGGIDYRVLNVWVEPGVLHLKIEPLGPHHRTARRTHDWPF
ncbi:MAG: hypothetical protein ACE5F9_15480, partial [Phycisphaerae bacterium]